MKRRNDETADDTTTKRTVCFEETLESHLSDSSISNAFLSQITVAFKMCSRRLQTSCGSVLKSRRNILRSLRKHYCRKHTPSQKAYISEAGFSAGTATETRL